MPTRSGKREGIPVVLMEAMASGLPVVSSAISGIPELIVDGESGVLVEQKDSAALCQALARLIADPSLRLRLAAEGFTRVRREFSMQRGIDSLVERLRASLER